LLMLREKVLHDTPADPRQVAPEWPREDDRRSGVHAAEQALPNGRAAQAARKQGDLASVRFIEMP